VEPDPVLELEVLDRPRGWLGHIGRHSHFLLSLAGRDLRRPFA
jgi:hypothetical protein